MNLQETETSQNVTAVWHLESHTQGPRISPVDYLLIYVSIVARDGTQSLMHAEHLSLLSNTPSPYVLIYVNQNNTRVGIRSGHTDSKLSGAP